LPGWDRPGWGRPIADAAAPLGFARGARLARWPWLTRQQIEVLETEDASLLMTLRAPPFNFGRWHVLDAEERRRGSVLLPHILDGDGSRFARLEATARGEQTLRGVSGAACATLSSRQDGSTLLAFAADVEPNPFARMLMLAAALLTSPAPV
jgi:hypothetical protein